MFEIPTPIRCEVVVRFDEFPSQLGSLGRGIATLSCLDDAGLVEITQAGTRQIGRISDRAVATAVWNEFCRGVATVLSITRMSEGHRVLNGLFHAFASPLLSLSGEREHPIEIEVDERVLPSDVSLHGLTQRVSLGSFGEFRSAGIGYALLLAPAGMESRENDGSAAAFSIVGAEHRVDVYELGTTASKRFVVRRVAKTRAKVDPAVRLARFAFNFVDQAAALRPSVLSKFETLAQDPGLYLKKWDRYETESLERTLERAKTVGEIAVNGRSVEGAGEVWDVAPSALDLLNVGDRLEPWSSEWERQFEMGDGASEGREGRSGSRDVVVEVAAKRRDERRIVVRRLDGSALTDAATWVLSLRGDTKQHDRRREARLRIMQGRSANPSLGLIIEGEMPPARQVGRKEVAAISPLVQRKLFSSRRPVDAQVEAVRIALNTPDIAIIQGPPGTGKTTVINAIYERLGEIASERGPSALPTLLTGPQHDAVLNMIERMDSRGLPIEKVGRRQGASSANEEEEQSQRLNRWLKSYREKVITAFPRFRDHEWTDRLRGLVSDYRRRPSDAAARLLMEEIWSAPGSLIDAEIRLRARLAAGAFERADEIQMDEFRSESIRVLMSLRTTAEGFADDGGDTIARLLAKPEIAERLSADEIARLQGIAEGSPDRPTLNWLRQLRRRLAAEFVPTFTGPAGAVRGGVVKLAEEAIDAARRSSKGDGPEAALATFVQQIEIDPDALGAAAREYATAVAATVQQSDSSDVSRTPLEDADSLKPRFDTVIVDEAARATPGDLMIPMTFARERIILVGDHRQLPHMVEEEIIRKLEQSAGSEGYREALQTSLFQHLKQQAEKLTAVDGIQRVVTLDAQFRMHPELGRFVSDTFYAPFGEGFGSPRPPEDFAHSLEPFVGSCLGWVDVVPQLGAEAQRGSTSWARIAEVNAISSLIRAWNLDEASKEMSVGVITFYSEQKKLISDRIAAEALDPHRRLTVGTVDSFQGREFDAVILSAVRTSHGSGRRPQYGHLKSANRLCVAMSRQKRLLVVVGDRAHFRGEDARDAVPGLCSFLGLCEAHNRVIRWEE